MVETKLTGTSVQAKSFTEHTTNTQGEDLVNGTRASRKAKQPDFVANALNKAELQASLEQSGASASLISGLLSSATFNNLSQTEKMQYVRVIKEALKADDSQLTERSLYMLATRQVDGKSALAQTDRGEQAKSLVANLHALATGKVISPLADKQKDILTSLLQEVANPDQEINQGKKYASCVVTTGFTTMARQHPAEYARLVADITMHGRAELPGAAQTGEAGMGLNYVSWAATSEALVGRSITESLTQTAALKMSNGVENGLRKGDAEQFYETCFGMPCTRLDAAGLDLESFVSTMAGVAASDGGINMLSMQWARKGSGIHLNHAIEVTGVQGAGESAEILFRNPMGKEFQVPEFLHVRVVDKEKAIYAISAVELHSRFNYLIATDQNGAFGRTPGWEVAPEGLTLFVMDDPLLALLGQDDQRRKEAEEREKQLKLMGSNKAESNTSALNTQEQTKRNNNKDPRVSQLTALNDRE